MQLPGLAILTVLSLLPALLSTAADGLVAVKSPHGVKDTIDLPLKALAGLAREAIK